MWILMDVMIKIIPIVVAVFAILRFLITTTNKTIIEIILTPNNKKHWENFYELVVISLIVTAGVFVPVFIKFPFSSQVINILFIIDFVMLLVTGITVIVLWIMSWFEDISNRKKLIQVSVLGNFLLVLIFISLIFSTLDKESSKLIIDQDNVELVLVYTVCVGFVFSLFQIYRFVFKSLYNPPKNVYQIEPIESSEINEELKQLKFEFMIDDERHVMSLLASRRSLDFPIFIYYPKEEKLIKYIKVNDSSEKK